MKPSESAANPIRTRQNAPRPSQSLNRKMIFAVLSLFAVFVGAICFQSLSAKTTKADTNKTKHPTALPGERVNELPDNYLLAELNKIKPEATPTAVSEKKTTKGLSAEEELIRDAKLKRLKSAMAAREADLSFKAISYDSNQNSNFKESSLQAENEQISSPSITNSRDDANRQDDKRAFLNSKGENQDVLANRVRDRQSDFQLSAGTIIPGVLLSGINSDLPGQILGQVSQNIYDSVNGKYLLIPQGAKILGEYDSRVVYGQERVLIVWTRILFPDGSSINLEGMPGVDMSGYAGLSDRVNNHYGKLITGVILSSLLSAGAQMADGPTYETLDPSYGQLAGQGAAKEINQVGQQITQKNLNVQPTLEIRPGYRFNVFVSKDMVLRAL